MAETKKDKNNRPIPLNEENYLASLPSEMSQEGKGEAFQAASRKRQSEITKWDKAEAAQKEAIRGAEAADKQIQMDAKAKLEEVERAQKNDTVIKVKEAIDVKNQEARQVLFQEEQAKIQEEKQKEEILKNQPLPLNVEPSPELLSAIKNNFGTGIDIKDFFDTYTLWQNQISQYPELANSVPMDKESLPYLKKGQTIGEWIDIVDQIAPLYYSSPQSEYFKEFGSLDINNLIATADIVRNSIKEAPWKANVQLDYFKYPGMKPGEPAWSFVHRVDDAKRIHDIEKQLEEEKAPVEPKIPNYFINNADAKRYKKDFGEAPEVTQDRLKNLEKIFKEAIKTSGLTFYRKGSPPVNKALEDKLPGYRAGMGFDQYKEKLEQQLAPYEYAQKMLETTALIKKHEIENQKLAKILQKKEEEIIKEESKAALLKKKKKYASYMGGTSGVRTIDSPDFSSNMADALYSLLHKTKFGG